MALLNIGNRFLNNLERNKAAGVFHMDFTADMVQGDYVFLGVLPDDILVTSLSVIVRSGKEAMAGTTCFVGSALLTNNNTEIGFQSWGHIRPQHSGLFRLAPIATDNIDGNGDPYVGETPYKLLIVGGMAIHLDLLPGIIEGSTLAVVVDYIYIGNKQTGGYMG